MQMWKIKTSFIVKSEFLFYLFIYLCNADVENCGEVRDFGFIYIYKLINSMLTLFI